MLDFLRHHKIFIFPAAAAEKAQDKNYWRCMGRETPPHPGVRREKDSSEVNPEYSRCVKKVLNWLVFTRAPGEKLKYQILIRRLINANRQKMKQRQNPWRLHPFYQTGAIGLIQ